MEAQAAYLKALDLLLPGEFDYEYIQMKFKDIQSEDLNEAPKHQRMVMHEARSKKICTKETCKNCH